MHHAVAVVTPLEAGLLPLIDELALHEVRVVGGCGLTEFAERLATGPAMSRPIFSLDLVGSTMPSLHEGAIAQLARIVGELWLSAWSGEDFADLREDALSLAHPSRRFGAPGLRPADLRR